MKLKKDSPLERLYNGILKEPNCSFDARYVFYTCHYNFCFQRDWNGLICYSCIGNVECSYFRFT